MAFCRLSVFARNTSALLQSSLKISRATKTSLRFRGRFGQALHVVGVGWGGVPKLTTGREIASRRRFKNIQTVKKSKSFNFSTTFWDFPTFRDFSTFRLFATFRLFDFSTFRDFSTLSTFRLFGTFRLFVVILRLCPRTAARDHSRGVGWGGASMPRAAAKTAIAE